MKKLIRELTWPKIFVLAAIISFALAVGLGSVNLGWVGIVFILAAIAWWIITG